MDRRERKRVVHENLARLMSQEDRTKYGIKTMNEILSEQEVKLERDLHNMFIAFLTRHELGYYHADPTRKSTIAIGMPDFGVFRNSRIIWIEFKVGKNRLSHEQHDKIAAMLADGNEVRLCYEYSEATELVRNFFGIKQV